LFDGNGGISDRVQKKSRLKGGSKYEGVHLSQTLKLQAATFVVAVFLALAAFFFRLR